MARPRTVSNKELIEAAFDLLLEHGLKGLTFDQLGRKVKLVPAALVRRFGDKYNLLKEVDQYALARSSERLQKVMSEQDSPIEAILAGFVMEMSFATTIKRFIHGQEYLLMDLADKDLYVNYQASFRERHRQVADLLKEAQERGQISKDIDVEEFAQFLQVILHGTGHVWAMTQEGPIEAYINRYTQLALRPYKLAGSAAKERLAQDIVADNKGRRKGGTPNES